MNNSTEPSTVLGQHVILDLHECDRDLLNSLDFVEVVLVEAANIAQCNILNKYFHKFSPQGVTGVVAVSESHFSIHTWPEHGYCAVDVFCCKENIEDAILYLKRAFKSKRLKLKTIKRGLFNENNIHKS